MTKKVPKKYKNERDKKNKIISNSWYSYKSEELAKILAKERDNYTCQYCFKQEPNVQIHASHVKSVGAYNFLKADLDNIKALCSYHHIGWWHKNPDEAGIWWREEFSERAEYLDEMIKERKSPNWKIVYEDLKQKYDENIFQASRG